MNRNGDRLSPWIVPRDMPMSAVFPCVVCICVVALLYIPLITDSASCVIPSSSVRSFRDWRSQACIPYLVHRKWGATAKLKYLSRPMI